MFINVNSRISCVALLAITATFFTSQEAYADLSGFSLRPSLTVRSADFDGMFLDNMQLYESTQPLDFGESVELVPTSPFINPAVARSTVSTIGNTRTIVFSITAVGDNGFGTPDAYTVPGEADSTGWGFSYRQNGLTIDPDQISTATRINEIIGIGGEVLRQFSFSPSDIGSSIAPSWITTSSGTANPFGPSWNGGTPAEIRTTVTYTVVPTPSGVSLLAIAGIISVRRRR